MFDFDFGDFNDTDFNFESLNFEDTGTEYTISTGVGNDLGLSTYDPDAVAENALDLAETEAVDPLSYGPVPPPPPDPEVIKAKAILAILLLLFCGVVGGYIIYDERKK
ncbi:hypothetical protein F4212_01810 [Candidatus Poribacteria bacterium]|nr:hypothetical protein [Candidatus Poribacteria bacterium]